LAKFQSLASKRGVASQVSHLTVSACVGGIWLSWLTPVPVIKVTTLPNPDYRG